MMNSRWVRRALAVSGVGVSAVVATFAYIDHDTDKKWQQVRFGYKWSTHVVKYSTLLKGITHTPFRISIRWN
jgi:hypothetical protein